MEATLNLCCIVAVLLLCGICLTAHRHRAPCVGLGAALACSLLLATVLFPAISMTDDLQSINLQAQIGLHSAMELVRAATVEPAMLHGVAMFAALIAAAMSMLVLARLAQSEPGSGCLRFGVLRYRPVAVRPPTVVAFA